MMSVLKNPPKGVFFFLIRIFYDGSFFIGAVTDVWQCVIPIFPFIFVYKINLLTKSIRQKNVIEGDTKVELERESASGIVELTTFSYWTLWAAQKGMIMTIMMMTMMMMMMITIMMIMITMMIRMMMMMMIMIMIVIFRRRDRCVAR